MIILNNLNNFNFIYIFHYLQEDKYLSEVGLRKWVKPPLVCLTYYFQELNILWNMT